jgi:3-oxochol-4-en-24-oyl-CoA dehydrogenase
VNQASTALPSADDLLLLDDSVADYCARALGIRRLRELRTSGRSFDRAVWAEMVELGWTGIALNEDDGGFGLGASGVARMCRRLGAVLAPEPVLECAVGAAALLAAIDQQGSRLQTLVAGDLIYTCPLHDGVWHAPSGLSARRDAAGFLLDGQLGHVPLANQADRLLLPVELDGRAALFDVARSASGLSLDVEVLADGTDVAHLTGTAVRCDGGNFIAFLDEHAQAVVRAREMSEIAASAYLLGLAEGVLEMTLEYVRTREQFGRAIGSFQALQHRLVDLYLQLRLCAAALDSAVQAHAVGESDGIVASRARQRASDVAMASVREAIQMHGAIGYTAESDVALYVWRALTLVARFGGALDTLKNNAAFMQTVLEGHADGDSGDAGADADFSPADGDWNSVADEHFRDTVRAWLSQNYPEQLQHLAYQVRWDEIRDWHLRLVERGWAAPAWPREYGGMALEPAKLMIFIEELERLGVARAPDQGIVMLGPILFSFGSDEQRARYLGPALRGDEIWCQGYSEPNAGSDLASLSTRAVKDGDEFIVNGQKTWTTHGQDATHMYCLVRTDPDCKPQAGISFLIIDLDQPGIEVRPIPNLSGDVDFCEVFFEDVRVPVANLVGEINQGWTIAKALLGHERLFVGSPKLCQHALNQLRQLARHKNMAGDAVFVDALARAALDVWDLEALYAEFAELAKAGKEFGADVALLKIWSTEIYQRLSEMIFAASGEFAAIPGAANDSGVDALAHYYNARPAPIYAGSNEIQRNIIARHTLKLPA